MGDMSEPPVDTSGLDPRNLARVKLLERATAEMRAAGVEPLSEYPGASKPWPSTCLDCGHEVAPRLGSIRQGRRGCRRCVRRAAAAPQRLDPAEAERTMRAAGLEPLEPYPGAMYRWRCRCMRCGDEVRPFYNSIQQRGGGCMACGRERTAAARRVPPDQAEAVMRAAGLEPLEPYQSARRPWRCRCNVCGALVSPAYATVSRGGGCNSCGRRSADQKRRLDEGVALARMEAAGLVPLTPYPGIEQPWPALCTGCGNQITPIANAVRNGAGPCPHCKGRKVSFNRRGDPSKALADVIEAGFEPLEAYPGHANDPWRCRHLACGREVAVKITELRGGRSGCLPCSLVTRGLRRRVPEADAVAVMRAAGLEPLEPYPGGSCSWRCQCSVCGNKVRPTYSTVRRGIRCRYCSIAAAAERQRTPFAERVWRGRVYLIRHDFIGAVKVGMTAVGIKTDRLAGWDRAGWEQIGTWDFDTYVRAYEVEQLVLTSWSSARPGSQLWGDGYTEMRPIEDVEVSKAVNLIEQNGGIPR